jgi:hypothetical protein
MEEARSYLRELEGLNIEIDRVKSDLKRLTQREAVLKENLKNYCREAKKPGVKYNNTVVMLETKPGRSRKKKAEQRASQAEVLRSRGINVDDSLLTALEEARRGEAIEVQRLKVQRKSTR